MSVLIFIDQADGQLKKATYEALSYGAAIAQKLGTRANALVLGTVSDDLSTLGKYGVQKVYHIADESLNILDTKVYAQVVSGAVRSLGSEVIVFAHNQTGRALAPRVAARLKAGLVTGALTLPDTTNGFIVKRSVFSGKAYANVNITSPIKVISLNLNSYPVKEGEGVATVESLSIAPAPVTIKVRSVNKIKGDIPLTEAGIVVSGGRGMKGPENWAMLEALAHELNAALACSRPVAESGWRPHHEHVGQTGTQIAPDLYLAVGISGAIQHLAGVNRSKNILVINKDAEAPFFKAADYGVVGDAFEIIPRLTEEVKKFKSK